MTSAADELTIRSRHGMLRDLIPIYSFYQLLPNLVAAGLIAWLLSDGAHLPAIFVMLALLYGWLPQYQSRPATMCVSPAQAAWLESLLDEQHYYERSETDGYWRTTGKSWWERWPHQFIAFEPGAEKTPLIAPRDVLEQIRVGLDLLEMHGEVWFGDGDRPFEFIADPNPVPWHVHVPAVVLGTACVVAWIGQLATGGVDRWGVSGDALAHGRYDTILLHMFAHGGLMHLLMNMSVLAAIGGALVARLGPTPGNWLRFLVLYLLSGLAGAALYLIVHPTGSVPMVGASGALYGLIGLLVRAPVKDGDLLSIRSPQMRRVGLDLIKQNAFLFGMLALMAWSQGSAGGLAWEAHLGGFLFGVFAGPWFLRRRGAAEASSEGDVVMAGQPASG